jgi:hypothetical protein
MIIAPMTVDLPRTVVRNFDEALNLIVFLIRNIDDLEKSRASITAAHISSMDRAERLAELESDLKNKQEKLVKILRELVRCPPYFKQYEDNVNKLARLVEKTFKERVNKQFAVLNETALMNSPTPPAPSRMPLRCKGSGFIMTKYPDGENPNRDTELETIHEIVKSSVFGCGYELLLANDFGLHPNLWENAECYMLACSYGIAIVESMFKPELNPNVAMEWGWMRAMRKPVLYLVEKNVKVVPVDVAGLIKARFDWQNPQADIPKIVTNYFQDQEGAETVVGI